VLDRHLEAVAPADLLLWSLRGLGALDPALVPELRGQDLRLLAQGGLLAAQRLPAFPARASPANLAPTLADLLVALLEPAWAWSAAVRRAGAEGLLRSAFEELFNHLDPYSRYVTPAESEAARERRVGQAGLGLRLAASGRNVVLGAVTPGGPAAQAGLRAGDRLIAIDGGAVSAEDLADAAARLEGPSGSQAVLTVLRGGQRRAVTVVRAPVPPETVAQEMRDDILWLRLSAFSAASDRQLTAALAASFATRPPRAVVLDLRGNRGGLLAQAVAIADIFLAGGEVARTVGRHRESRRVYSAGGPDLAQGRPVIVLVDGRSASAAEVVAAALADRGRAVVVGSATMGKGLVQLLVPLPDGGELLISWSRVLAPRGWPIQALGVLPALCTSLGTEVQAAQQARLAQGEAPMGEALARLRAARAPVSAGEAATIRNACPPAEGRDSDLAVAQWLAMNPAAYAAALPR
jgi:carboxyl-terminal processing protease